MNTPTGYLLPVPQAGREDEDKESGIVNDPNAWFADNPEGLVSHLRRLVQVSVETARVVEGLPPALEE